MADPAVSLLVQEVKRRIIWGKVIIHGVEGKLEKLIEKVKYIQKNLPSADMEEHLKENFERQLQEVLYNVVDNIESSASLMAATMGNFIFFHQIQIPFLAKKLEWEIDSIVYDTLEPIAHRIVNCETQQPLFTETNQVPSELLNKKVYLPAPDNVVGLEYEAKILINYLLVETNKVDVIAITGMAGIGKTTLASKIFHDNRIREVFPTRIWVDNFRRRRKLCLDILKQRKKTGADIPQESCSKDSSTRILSDFSQLNDDELMQRVREYLKKSKYLLVMDDVWDARLLEMVKDMLPTKGKVLITTRNKHITRNTHEMCFLTPEESWDLLQLKVFGKLGMCPKMLESTGKHIAKNCGGLPLAIEAVGGSLEVSSPDMHLTKKWWKVVSLNVTMFTDYSAQYRVFVCLELSYKSMDQRLQECFLYLGVFPEGHEIHVRTLVRLWIAEGFLNSMRLSLYKSAKDILGETKDSKLPDLESKANKYLDGLINRSLVMVAQRYTDGQIKTCRLHSLIYAFCKKKASDKHIYQQIIMTGDSPIYLAPNSRLSICSRSGLSSFLSSQPNERRVHSILYFKEEIEKEEFTLSHKESSRIPEWFKLLRVLDCRDINFTRFPDWLNELIHLRYISLCCNEISVIPKTIATLRYLQTLVVYTRSPSLRLQANIHRMIQLRHLVTKAAIVLATPGEGETANYLRTLTRLAPACCSRGVFKGTPNLETLGIRGNLATLSEPESLLELKSLQNLKLINEPAVVCGLRMDFPQCLTRLTLSGTCLEWKCMSTLGKISSLKIIKLKNNAFVGESWTSTRADGFDCLKFLLIDTTNLVSWDASADCFPTLMHLVLQNCAMLKVPSSLAKRPIKLDVWNEPEYVVESAR